VFPAFRLRLLRQRRGVVDFDRTVGAACGEEVAADEPDDEPDDELIGNDEPTDFIPPPRTRTPGKCTLQIVCDEPDEPAVLGRADLPDTFDWSAVAAGSGVWVQDEENGVLEGRLVALAGDKLSLLIDGETEPRDFDCEICTLGG
jgi:hypothetical protein